MSVKTYRELVAWNKAMDLVQTVYTLTKSFPTDERFGLITQLRKAAVSVPSNLAEGQGRGSRLQFAQFVSVAYGSLCEVETQLIIASRLHYLKQDDSSLVLDLTGEIGRLLNGLAKSLRRPKTTNCERTDN